MILENVCDFNHAFLHRDLRPFTDPHLREYFREGDSITMEYDTDLSQSQLVKVAGEKQGKDFKEDFMVQLSVPGIQYIAQVFALAVHGYDRRKNHPVLFLVSVRIAGNPRSQVANSRISP